MVSLQEKVFFVLYFYMLLVNLVSTSDKIDFQELLAENSQYHPMKNFCSLRILGGSPIDISEVPYQVLIVKSTGDFWSLVCGGSIITHEYVLTAAHCVHKASATRQYCVVAGTSQSNMLWYSKQNDQRRQMHSEVWRGISGFYVHQYYSTRNYNHDLAVVKLEFPVNFTQWVQAIPMLRPSQDDLELKKGDMCMVTGFGSMKRVTRSRRLQMVCVPFVTRKECNKLYGRTAVTDNQFCAGKSGKDSCEGDSGGPITFQGYLIGIVSGGKCGQKPGIYTNISAYTSGDSVPFSSVHFRDCSVTLSLDILRIISFVFLIFVYNFIVIKHFTL